jgi:hypothetical protein
MDQGVKARHGVFFPLSQRLCNYNQHWRCPRPNPPWLISPAPGEESGATKIKDPLAALGILLIRK